MRFLQVIIFFLILIFEQFRSEIKFMAQIFTFSVGRFYSIVILRKQTNFRHCIDL